MRKLTLADCENVKVTDLFLGLALFEPTDKDAEIIETQRNSPEEIEKANGMFAEMRKHIDETVPPEFADAFMSLMTDVVKLFPVKLAQPMFLLRLDGHYYSLNDGDLDPEKAIRIENLEPFSEHYSSSEYRFVEINGKVCLDVDSPEPFYAYSQRVLGNCALI